MKCEKEINVSIQLDNLEKNYKNYKTKRHLICETKISSDTEHRTIQERGETTSNNGNPKGSKTIYYLEMNQTKSKISGMKISIAKSSLYNYIDANYFV